MHGLVQMTCFHGVPVLQGGVLLHGPENHGAYAQLILEQVMQRTIHTKVVQTLHLSIAGSLQHHLTARSMQCTNLLRCGVRDLYRILMPCGIQVHSYIIACSC